MLAYEDVKLLVLSAVTYKYTSVLINLQKEKCKCSCQESRLGTGHIPVRYIPISSVERQKGAINIQRCSIENQKSAIAVQSLW